MKKILFIAGVILLLIASFLVASRYKNKPLPPSASKKIIITTTLFPLYDIAKQVGQDRVEVHLLLPPGIEAHAFDPTPSDVVRINQSGIFIFTGKFMEPWAEDILQQTAGKNLIAVDSSDGINLLPADSEKGNIPGNFDPHIWLDFANTQIIVDNITRALVEKDSAHAQFYRLNAQQYKEQLTFLDTIYKNNLAQCTRREIIYSGHYAFGYLGKRYDLNYASAYGLSPDSEPSAQDLIQMIKQIRTDGVHYIFSEEMLSPKIAQTLSQETTTQILTLNPAHNLSREEFQSGRTFFDIMQNNLTNLSIGLDCKK